MGGERDIISCLDGMNNNFMSRLSGFIVSLVLLVVVICTTRNIGLAYEHRIQGVSVAVVLIWGALLIKAKGWRDYKKIEMVLAIVLFVGLGLYMGMAWHRGYITNTPLISINAETEGIYRDTLYHNAIASSIEYYGYPSLLVNSAAFHNYHFGSHLVLGLISRIMRMPSIFTYCYIYPMVFFPLFSSLVLSVGKAIKGIVICDRKISLCDVVVLMIFFTYFILPQAWSEDIGNWKTSWLVSESYCVANVIGLVYFKIGLELYARSFFEKRINRVLFSLLCTPFFIVAVSVSKISVGLLFTFAIVYLLFRREAMNAKYLLVEIFYVIIVFAVHFIPSKIYSPILSGTEEGIYSISLFDYLRSYVGDYTLWGVHILAFFFFSFVFIAYMLKEVSSFSDLIKNIVYKKYIVVELLVLVCIIGSLPGTIITIGGGSAFYFYSVQNLFAAVLLIGYDVPSRLFRELNVNKNRARLVTTVFIVACLSINFAVSSLNYARQLRQDCTLSDEQYGESIKETSYWAVINEINEITDGHKEDFYIYVCSSANVWSKYANPDSALFFYPAMTGVVCIGELYFANGQLYTNNDVAKDGGYTYQPEYEERKMTEEDAYLKAKEDGKKAIIYIYDNTFSVREI